MGFSKDILLTQKNMDVVVGFCDLAEIVPSDKLISLMKEAQQQYSTSLHRNLKKAIVLEILLNRRTFKLLYDYAKRKTISIYLMLPNRVW